jgi:hypothetical protein
MNATNKAAGRERDADEGIPPPKAGDRFRCSECGMEIQVTADCHCKDGEHVHFHCCGREMVRA